MGACWFMGALEGGYVSHGVWLPLIYEWCPLRLLFGFMGLIGSWGLLTWRWLCEPWSVIAAYIWVVSLQPSWSYIGHIFFLCFFLSSSSMDTFSSLVWIDR
jgi:hypothetical protein